MLMTMNTGFKPTLSLQSKAAQNTFAGTHRIITTEKATPENKAEFVQDHEEYTKLLFAHLIANPANQFEQQPNAGFSLTAQTQEGLLRISHRVIEDEGCLASEYQVDGEKAAVNCYDPVFSQIFSELAAEVPDTRYRFTA
jgi:hypothetical protein